MAYQALYRQWRPNTFSEMVGQELVVTALRNQVQHHRIAHAFLFTGSRGTGKTSTAKILARAVNCENPQEGDACGVCESCRRMQEDASFDVLEYDAASNSRVEDMREILEATQYPPQFGRYKVYIIDEVHMLSGNAFNALLKTLEEPPEYMIFVLATTEPQKVPATILSRCQRYDFGRIPADKIAARLQAAADGCGAETTPEALELIALAAEGGMRDALSILDMCIGYGTKVDAELVRQVLGTSHRDFLFRFSEALLRQDCAGALSLVDELMREGREPAAFAREMARHLRGLLMAKACGSKCAEVMELSAEDADAYLHQAEDVTDTRLLSMMDQFMNVETQLRLSSSPRVALEAAALRACLRTGEADTAALEERILVLERQLAELQGRLASGEVNLIAIPSQPSAEPGEWDVEPAPVREAPPKDAQAVWRSAVTALSTAHPSIFGVLSGGKLTEAANDRYLWAPKDAGATFGLDYLSDPTRARIVSEALSFAAKKPCTFAVQRPDQPVVSGVKDDMIQTLRQVFGADRVTVQE
ncbi:MAG: DNA polymerase III subunit gamma/tau [Clostridia bacterium]|nr:DNA polymerase III subunit gamma/tau [Clostridia bacterium]